MNSSHLSAGLAAFFLVSSGFIAPAHAVSEEVNLSLAPSSPLYKASDSIDHTYNHQVSALADGKSDTAWITGLDQDRHWAEIIWRGAAVEVRHLEIDATPMTVDYRPVPGFLEQDASVTARQFQTSVPAEWRVEVRQGGVWKTVQPSALHSEDPAKIRLTFSPPLTDITGIRLHLPETTPDQIYAIREWRVMGVRPQGSAGQTPAWTAVWIWGEMLPTVPTRGIIRRYFRHDFDLGQKSPVVEAVLMAAAHDRSTVFLNGTKILQTTTGESALQPRLARAVVPLDLFREGKNLLAIEGEDIEGFGLRGVIAELWLKFADGSTQIVATDANWSSSTIDEDGWQTQPDAFVSWTAANVLASPNSKDSAYSLDFSPPFWSDTLTLKAARLDPPIPRAGEKFRLDLDFEAKKPLDTSYRVVVNLGEAGPISSIYANFALGEIFTPASALPQGFVGRKTVSLDGTWPAGTPPRLPVTIRVCNRLKQARLDSDNEALLTLQDQPGWLKWMAGKPVPPTEKTGFSDNKISSDGRLTVDGSPLAPIIFTTALITPGAYVDWAGSGVDIFRVAPHATITTIPPKGEEEAFFARIFESLQLQIETLQAINPRARFLVLVDLDAPNEWVLENSESQILSPGGGQIMTTDLEDKLNGFLRETPNAPSYLHHMRHGLSEFVRRLEKQPYASRVMGLFFSRGRGGENYWGGADIVLRQDENGIHIPPREEYEWGDVSPVARRSFRDWLKKKYQTTEALRAAWKMPDVDFDDVVSTRKWPGRRFTQILMWRNRPEGRFMFRDRREEGSFFADFTQHHNNANADGFLEAGRAVKEASGHRLLVGGYLGYSVPGVTGSPPMIAQQSGHIELRKILESPFFDFSVSPHMYHFRRAGDPVMPAGTVDSFRLHGKMWINEFDSRSYLSPIPPKTFSQKETFEVFRKEFGYAITKNQGWWWYEFPIALSGAMAASWFGDEKLQDDAGIMKRVYQKALSFPAGGPSAQCAVIFDVEQPYYTDGYSPSNTVGSAVVNNLIPKLFKLGPSFDIYAQSDLPALVKKGWLKNYKFLLFVNAYHIDADTRRLIEDEVKKDGRTVVFTFAPGYLGNDQEAHSERSIAGIEQVLGMKGVSILPEKHILGMKLKDGSAFDLKPWWEGLQITTYGQEIGPVFYLDPARSDGWETLAFLRLDERDEPGRVALARRTAPDYTIYYSATPDLPLESLSTMLRESGVHFFASAPGILTWSNERFLCVHARTAQTGLVLTAPKAVSWIEPFEGRRYASSTDRITLDMGRGETRFFCLAEGDEWNEFVREPAAPAGEGR